MGLWLCKQMSSDEPSTHLKEQLQSKVLEYIFSPSPIKRNPRIDFKNHRIFGYSSLELFVTDIPPQLHKKIAKSFEQDPYIQRFTIGDRCMTHDLEILGTCTGIEVTHNSGTNKYSIFILLVEDSKRKSGHSSKSPQRFPIGSLITEKFYFYQLLSKSEVDSSDMSKRSHEEAFHEPSQDLAEVKAEKKHAERLPNDDLTHIALPKIYKQYDAVTTIAWKDGTEIQPDITNPKLYSVKEEFVDTTGISSDEKSTELIPSVPPTKKRNTFQKSTTIKVQAEDSFKPSKLCGLDRGIQGRNNSCYLDALLFSLFYSTLNFDNSLLMKKTKDSDSAASLRNILRETIARNLREKHFCTYEEVRELRQFLGKFDARILGAMMDVEEAFYLIVQEVLKETKYFQYEEGTGEYMHQIFISEEEDSPKTATIQTLLENSFQLWGNLKLSDVPAPGFIVGIPRSDGDLIHFTNIVPSLELNLSSLMDSRKCQLCTIEDAEWKEVVSENNEGNKKSKYLCKDCAAFPQGEAPRISNSNSKLTETGNMSRQFISMRWMDLYSVICIRSAHYVCFTRNTLKRSMHESAGYGTWLFFDSMAGSSSEVTQVEDLSSKLKQVADSDDISQAVERQNCPYIKRITEDGHLCIYAPRTRWF